MEQCASVGDFRSHIQTDHDQSDLGYCRISQDHLDVILPHGHDESEDGSNETYDKENFLYLDYRFEHRTETDEHIDTRFNEESG